MNVFGYLLITLCTFFKMPQSTELGELSFFDHTCGACWEEVTDVGGMVLVPAENYRGTAVDGRPENFTYITGDIGGEIRHTINIDELTTHTHPIRVNTNNANAGNRVPYSSVDSASFTNSDDITVVGGDQDHNNMQPFVAKPLCRKVCEDEYALQADFDALRDEFDAIKGLINFTLFTPSHDDGNQHPRVAKGIDDILMTAGKASSAVIPQTAFVDDDGDELELTATLSNGEPLPDFLEFSSDGWKFLGSPKEEDIENYRIKVVASDGRGGQISEVFFLLVSPAISTTWIETDEQNLQVAGFSYGLIGGFIIVFSCCGAILLFFVAQNTKLSRQCTECCTECCERAENDQYGDEDLNFDFALPGSHYMT